MVKKSYNPFKMWGSYVGLVVGAITLYLIVNIFKSYDFGCKQFFCNGNLIGLTGVFIIFIVGSILGFLIGYGIHALIRVIKN